MPKPLKPEEIEKALETATDESEIKTLLAQCKGWPHYPKLYRELFHQDLPEATRREIAKLDAVNRLQIEGLDYFTKDHKRLNSEGNSLAQAGWLHIDQESLQAPFWGKVKAEAKVSHLVAMAAPIGIEFEEVESIGALIKRTWPKRAVLHAGMGAGKTTVAIPNFHINQGGRTILLVPLRALRIALRSDLQTVLEPHGIPVIDPGEKGPWKEEAEIPANALVVTTPYKWVKDKNLQTAFLDGDRPYNVIVDEYDSTIRDLWTSNRLSQLNREECQLLIRQAQAVLFSSGTPCPIVLGNLTKLVGNYPVKGFSVVSQPFLDKRLYVRPSWPKSEDDPRKLPPAVRWAIDFTYHHRQMPTSSNRPVFIGCLGRENSEAIRDGLAKAGFRAAVINGDNSDHFETIMAHLKAGFYDVLVMNSAGGSGISFIGQFGAVGIVADHFSEGMNASILSQLLCRERAANHYEILLVAQTGHIRLALPSELELSNDYLEGIKVSAERLMANVSVATDYEAMEAHHRVNVQEARIPNLIAASNRLSIRAYKHQVLFVARKLGFSLVFPGMSPISRLTTGGSKVRTAGEGFWFGRLKWEDFRGYLFGSEDWAQEEVIEWGLRATEDLGKGLPLTISGKASLDAIKLRGFWGLSDPGKAVLAELYREGGVKALHQLNHLKIVWDLAIWQLTSPGWEVDVKGREGRILDSQGQVLWAHSWEAGKHLSDRELRALQQQLLVAVGGTGQIEEALSPDDPRQILTPDGLAIGRLWEYLKALALAPYTVGHTSSGYFQQIWAASKVVGLVLPRMKGCLNPKAREPWSVSLDEMGLSEEVWKGLALSSVEATEIFRCLGYNMATPYQGQLLWKLAGLPTEKRVRQVSKKRVSGLCIPLDEGHLEVLSPSYLPGIAQPTRILAQWVGH